MENVRNIAMLGRPTVDIQLEKAALEGCNLPAYSTMDRIDGQVHITAKSDTKFDDIAIALTGRGRTWMERTSAAPTLAGRQEAEHRFLRLNMPITEESLPSPRILKAGQPYTFPFTFVVPERILPRSCPHRVTSDQVREAHLQMPPSFGEHDFVSLSRGANDDLAPEMSKIHYSIGVKLTRTKAFGDEEIETVVVEKSRKIRVRPAVEEAPPLTFGPTSTEYETRIEKTIRRGMFKGLKKLGKLVMESTQPRAFVLPWDEPDANVTTVVRVKLRFDPADGSESIEPPKLSTLQSKLKVTTFFATAPLADFPTRNRLQYDFSQSWHGEALALTSRCVENVPWIKHGGNATSSQRVSPEPPSPTTRKADDEQRHDSTTSDALPTPADAVGPSSDYPGGDAPFYTAQIIVPVTLPRNKRFVPTFHACLTSRVYAISLHLALQSSGRATPATTLTLRLPVQIAQQGTPEREEERRASLRAQEAEWEADEVFSPRRPTVFGEEVLGRNASLGGGSDTDGGIGPASGGAANGPPEYYGRVAGSGGHAVLSSARAVAVSC